MKPTFLNQARPFVTGMVLKSTPDEVRYAVKNSVYEGADALGIQLCRLKKQDKTEENFKKMFAAAGQKPIYVTNYRYCENTGRSDEECMEELIAALACGATLADIMGDTFAPAPMELTTDSAAIERQVRLIDRIHAMGKEVLMSSHILQFTPAEQVLQVALEHEKRGADIAKIVTAGNSDEEEMENLRITRLLQKELRIPFLFLSGGTHSKIHRGIGPMLGCFTYLCVWRHDETSVPTQPTIRAAKQIRDSFDYLPDIIDG